MAKGKKMKKRVFFDDSVGSNDIGVFYNLKEDLNIGAGYRHVENVLGFPTSASSRQWRGFGKNALNISNNLPKGNFSSFLYR